ncbi:glycosyltransferase family 2 protein [Nitrospira moscoviensis]|uniref:Putative enzyme n=1 Tax=Nitrospira moscoviensis TaxID=42253 RepID=A0A0K2GFN1_NITMO|nr:glycosyltransferase family 2 protein [Nitrospira moscoviensis]ALA59770.1 putative enzyme [Nitrospira moscoviensis]
MIQRTKPLISVVVPAYNEQDNLPELYRRVTDVFEKLDVDLELLIIDDASSDGTLNWLRKTGREDRRLRFVSFSRNFGHQAGVTAGLQHAMGDAVVVIDADLQDPPEVLPQMIQRWREGYQIVMGQRIQREGDPLAKRLFAWGYYRVLARLSKVKIPVDGGDFCLMDRVVVDTLNRLPERNRYVRGLRAWVGFRQTNQPFQRHARFKGEPKYNFFKSLSLAMDGLVSFSYLPLRLATYVGLAAGAMALIMVVLVLYWRFFTNAPLVGYAILVTTFLCIASVQLLTIGIMGEYVGRIYDEVKGRPHYIVKETNQDLDASKS